MGHSFATLGPRLDARNIHGRLSPRAPWTLVQEWPFCTSVCIWKKGIKRKGKCGEECGRRKTKLHLVRKRARRRQELLFQTCSSSTGCVCVCVLEQRSIVEVVESAQHQLHYCRNHTHTHTPNRFPFRCVPRLVPGQGMGRGCSN